ncbi:hypothetical protein DYB34_007009 [Aphanomyces astaci]|uniref:PDZ domain-containing protein n=1 Tax=Aphanomyces astaci TaxID=112090 RepID=A0A418BFK1_APHAT|nr:hypothetical protein DYB34_007009 [Aphanomyces astaci]
MDAWSTRDLLPLELGGNGKWNAVCVAAGLSRASTADKYGSVVADAYRTRMQTAVQSETPFTLVEILTWLNLPLDVPAVPSSSTSPVRRHASSVQLSTPQLQPPAMVHLRKQASLEVKCTLCHDFVSVSKLDMHSQRCAASIWTCMLMMRQISIDRFFVLMFDTYEELEFDTILGRHPTGGDTPAPLGLSLAKSIPDGGTLVSKIVPGGDADVAGVIVGSQVLSINHVKSSNFNTLMQYLSQPSVPRPLAFSFRIRRPVVVLDVTFDDDNPPPSPSRSSKTASTSCFESCSDTAFKRSSLGMAVAMSVHNQCRVMSVDADGAAAKRGIAVGCTIVAVNEQTCSGARGVFASLQSLGKARPLRLRLHRRPK